MRAAGKRLAELDLQAAMAGSDPAALQAAIASAKEHKLGSVTLPAEKRLAELGLQAAIDGGDAKALKAAIVSAKYEFLNQDLIRAAEARLAKM